MTPTFLRLPAVALVALACAACGPRPAPDISGRWKAVNQYAEQTEEIPLQQAYVYQAAPLDRTLKTMLERWARDSKLQLAYEHGSDFTLHAPVARMRSTQLTQATAELTSIYAPQRVVVFVDGNRLIVRHADAIPATAGGTGG